MDNLPDKVIFNPKKDCFRYTLTGCFRSFFIGNECFTPLFSLQMCQRKGEKNLNLPMILYKDR